MLVFSAIFESRNGVVPFGAKGVGEPAISPVALTIAKANADATGVRVFEKPIPPELIVTALTAHERLRHSTS